MALAPAFIVSNMVSSEGPPVAIMGSFGYSFLILATIFGVSVEADTFNILAPAFILPSKSVSSLITPTITGISKAEDKVFNVSLEVGAFKTTPMAP